MTDDALHPVTHFGLLWQSTSHASASAVQIHDIEHALGVKFPDSILALVQISDGMQPEFQFIWQGGQVSNAFARLLRFSDGEILRAHEAMLEDAENTDRSSDELRWVIPFADDGDGWICLDFRGDQHRVAYRVVSYDFSRVSRDDPHGLDFIAGDFETLLRMLGPGES